MKKFNALNKYAQPFLFVIVYWLIYILIQEVLFKLGIFATNVNSLSLIKGDANMYRQIALNGYVKNTISNGFFILLPLIWSIFKAKFLIVLLLNITWFAIGFSIIVNLLNDNKIINWIFYITLPAFFYIIVPYSEALFFMLSSLMLYAIQRNNKPLLFSVLLLLSLVRPTCILLLPALFIMTIICNPKSNLLKNIFEYIYVMAVPLILGLAIFIYIQFLQTGEWFIYFKTQATVWDRHFSWPTLEFVTIPTAKNLWLNGLAFLLNIVAFIHLIKFCINYFKKNILLDKILVLSFAYLSMVLFTILFFNPKYGNTSVILVGTFRYTFIAPFIFVLFKYFHSASFTKKQLVAAFVGINILWVFFKIFSSIKTFASIAVRNDIFVGLYLLQLNYIRKKHVLLLLVILNFIVQIIFYQNFMANKYMD